MDQRPEPRVVLEEAAPTRGVVSSITRSHPRRPKSGARTHFQSFHKNVSLLCFEVAFDETALALRGRVPCEGVEASTEGSGGSSTSRKVAWEVLEQVVGLTVTVEVKGSPDADGRLTGAAKDRGAAQPCWLLLLGCGALIASANGRAASWRIRGR